MANKIKIRSIMTVPIIGISYKIKNQTTICKIRWINPCNGNVQVIYGVATCNPKDNFDEKIGQRLSESRAKISLYDTYMESIDTQYKEVRRKHRKLINKEIEHQNKIKPSKYNKIK